MKKLLLPIFLVSLAFTFTQCSKEGPAGPQGPDGAAGPAGPTGATGATGTANVIYSPWFLASTMSWADSSMANYANAKRAIHNAPRVTQAIIDQGIILCYTKGAATGAGPYQLPMISASNYMVNFVPAVGKIVFFVSQIGGSATNSFNLGYSFRYVLIPGGVSAGRMMTGADKTAEINNTLYTESELKAMPYSDMCKLLGIEE